MRRVRSMLVTGGAGFIGSNLVHWAIANRPELRVVTLDALTYAGSRENLEGLTDPSRHHFVHGDVTDAEGVARVVHDHAIDTVVHLAAESHVDRSIEAPRVFLRTNVEGTAAALQGAWSVWKGGRMAEPRFHHVSTDEVYGDLEDGAPPSRVGDRYRPSSPYSASKAAADHLVWAWRRTYGVPVSVSASTNTYGPRQYAEKLLPTVIRRAVAGEPIPIYGDGQQVRDWLHVEDHVEGIMRAIERGPEGAMWHLAGDHPLANLELARQTCAWLDRLRPAGAPHAQHLAFVEDRPGHDRRYGLDTSATRTGLGWSPTVGFDEGLAATVAWYLESL